MFLLFCGVEAEPVVEQGCLIGTVLFNGWSTQGGGGRFAFIPRLKPVRVFSLAQSINPSRSSNEFDSTNIVHLLHLNDEICELCAWMEVSLDTQRSGTLILDIPIDISKPNPIKLRGLEARMLDGAAPFDISSNIGTPRSELLYYNEVEHVIAINFSPDENSFSIGAMTAEPISDVSLLEAYAIPEFGHMVGLAVGLTLAIAFVTVMRKIKL
jgi:hypothetical protein